jgi:hypothetical protein
VYHSHPYFFVLWIFNLMGAVSICLIFITISNTVILLNTFLGKIYFKLCNFILCGSNLSETAYMLIMVMFIIYSAIDNIVIVLLFMHFMVLIYRGRPTNQPSIASQSSTSMLQIILFSQMMLLLDYAVYE